MHVPPTFDDMAPPEKELFMLNVNRNLPSVIVVLINVFCEVVSPRESVPEKTLLVKEKPVSAVI